MHTPLIVKTALRDSNLDRWGQPGRTHGPALALAGVEANYSPYCSSPFQEHSLLFSRSFLVYLFQSYLPFRPYPLLFLILCETDPTHSTYFSLLRIPTAPIVWMREFTLESNNEATWVWEPWSKDGRAENRRRSVPGNRAGVPHHQSSYLQISWVKRKLNFFLVRDLFCRFSVMRSWT